MKTAYSIINLISKLIILFTLGISLESQAQQGQITGRILEANSEIAIQYASVVCYKAIDQSIAGGTLAAEDGTFRLEKIPFGEYYVSVQFMGYKTYNSSHFNLSSANQQINLGSLMLQKTNYEIDEVQISGERVSVEYKIDKKVVNVSKQLSAAGGTATDAIRDIPSVETSLDGEIKLRGSSNFTLLIDGKPTVISASDLLDQIPASTIDQIEIITNPSAKYDPDGTSGIINIILKKNALEGFSGVVNLSGGTGIQYSGDASIAYRTDKYTLSAGIEISENNIANFEESERESTVNDTINYLSTFDSGNRFNDKKSIRAGANFYLTKNNTLTLSGNYSDLSFGHNTTGKSHLYTAQNPEGTYFLSDNQFKINPKLFEFTLGDEQLLDSTGQHKLSFNLFAVSLEVNNTELLDKYVTDASFGNKISQYDQTQRNTAEKVNLYDIDLDYETPIGKNGKLEAGYQGKIFNASNDYIVYSLNHTNQELVLNAEQSNSVDFTRQIHALYTTFSYSFGDWQTKAGLRAEYTNQLLTQETMNTSYKYVKTDLYPSVYLSRSLPDNQQIQISYSRRTDRPQTQFLNPYTFFSDGFTAVKGNPELEPDFTNAFELNYQKRFGASYFSVEPYFRQTFHKITRVQELNDDGVLIRTMKNLDNDYSLGVELMGGIKVASWLELVPRATWFKYHLEGEYETDYVNKESYNWRAGLTANLQIKSNTTLQLTSNYDGPGVTLDGEMDGFLYTGIAVKQFLFNRSASLSLRVEDIFDTRHMSIMSSSDGFYQTSEMYVEAPQVTLGFTWQFNNFERTSQKKKDVINQFNIY